jgi:hypothetical protein
MKRYLAAALVLQLCAVPVSAQSLVIHGHPEKLVYATQDEWPFDDAQCHWKRSNLIDSIFIPGTMFTLAVPHSLGHTHTGMFFPRDAEISGPFQANFVITSFFTSGRVTGFYKDHVRDLVFDDTGTSEMPLMVGDPHTVKQWKGHLTVDIGMEQPPYTNVLHGWTTADLVAITDIDDGDHIEARLVESVWSMLDPTVPVPAYNPHVFGTRCDAQSPLRESESLRVNVGDVSGSEPAPRTADRVR